jgi:hypothetical protein
MLYEWSTLRTGVGGALDRSIAGSVLLEDCAMTIEILYLTSQIQRWLNRSVARHLAAQAAKIAR